MKNKTTAAILALLFGGIGIHRFYLGQTVLGIIYIFLAMTGISFLLSIIDAIILFTMPQEVFDAKYNRDIQVDSRHRRRAKHTKKRHQRHAKVKKRHQVRGHKASSPTKKTAQFSIIYFGAQKAFKAYQFIEAEKLYLEALALEPNHPELLFNMACLYSMQEKADKSFEYLSLAVQNGYFETSKIESEPSLAYLRVQDGFLDFAKAGYQLKSRQNLDKTELLEQLRQLDLLKSRGLLTETEFELEREKILR